MKVFADLHIHIGRAGNNKPVKITASKDLTFENIVKTAAHTKGLSLIGIIDCASPYVIDDIKEFLKNNIAYEQKQGGIIYDNKICVLLGSEVETEEIDEKGQKGLAHNVCFFKHLKDIEKFSNIMQKYITNITLSTQHARLSGYELIDIVSECNGILIPAHIFTPFKSYYGNCTDRLKNIFKEKLCKIKAVELGLSADTFLADTISELKYFKFLTNSDAHSLPKIAREYNLLELEDISFEAFEKLINAEGVKGDEKNYIISNYGLNASLGKYNRTYCDGCESLSTIIQEEKILKNGNKKITNKCIKCGSNKIVKGVQDRIEEISDQKLKSPKERPPYIYQVPLEFIPKVGKKTYSKMLEIYLTEMNVLHKAKIEDLKEDFGVEIASKILDMRNNNLKFKAGGGGNYGNIL